MKKWILVLQNMLVKKSAAHCDHKTKDITLVCMKVMAYVTVAAVAAAGQSGMLAKVGQAELQWMELCNMYGKFCNQVGEGMATAFVVSLSMVVLSCISAFSLFRLYGGHKMKNVNC